MGYEVRTAAAYDARFDEMMAYRMTYVGPSSARRLLQAQDEVEQRLAALPRSGTPLDPDEADPAGDIPRWVSVGPYVAVYETYADVELVVLEDLFYPLEDWR